MLSFSANVSMMFTEHDVLDRFAATRDAGFDAVEIQFPYNHPVDAYARAREDAGLPVAVFNLPVGDMATGGPGFSAVPGREAEFRDAVAQALPYAEALAPYAVNLLAGWPPAELERERCMAVLEANATHAAEALAPLGVKVVVEAINTRDRPGFLLSTSRDVIAMLDRIGHPNLYLEYDLYHMQIMEGDLIPTMQSIISRIGHIQFADTPGRHEPGTGEINFPNVFTAMEDLPYDGFVGAEYVPSGRTEDSLGWMAAYR